MSRVNTTHPELHRGLDDPAELDRAWFRDHPQAITRIRPLLPDEYPALNAIANASGAAGCVEMQGIGLHVTPPQTHVVVVDVLRLNGEPHGPDGESIRVRFPCPEPSSIQIEKMIVAAALEVLATLYGRPQRSRRRRQKRGFA